MGISRDVSRALEQSAFVREHPVLVTLASALAGALVARHAPRLAVRWGPWIAKLLGSGAFSSLARRGVRTP
jgi:hypothetical protein